MLKKSLIVLVILISVSIIITPLFNLARGRRIGLLANYYHEQPIEIKKGNFSSLRIIDDVNALNVVEPTDVVLINKNGFDKTFDLIFTISKDSTINYNNLVICLDNNIKHLSDMIIDYDENYYYFNMGPIVVEAYSEDTHQFRMWMKENAVKLQNNSSLTINFITK